MKSLHRPQPEIPQRRHEISRMFARAGLIGLSALAIGCGSAAKDRESQNAYDAEDNARSNEIAVSNKARELMAGYYAGLPGPEHPAVGYDDRTAKRFYAEGLEVFEMYARGPLAERIREASHSKGGASEDSMVFHLKVRPEWDKRAETERLDKYEAWEAAQSHPSGEDVTLANMFIALHKFTLLYTGRVGFLKSREHGPSVAEHNDYTDHSIPSEMMVNLDPQTHRMLLFFQYPGRT